MRKNIHETSRSRGAGGLQLSRETIRTLTPEQLARVVVAVDTCPTGTDTLTKVTFHK
jgi:hypothetical protein